MKKPFVAIMLLLSYAANSQIQPYVDASVVWKPWMQGGAALDVGVNISHISLEVNSMALKYSRVGGSVGWQIGQRGGEWLAARPYVGMMYGKYSTAKTDGSPIENGWNYTAGAKLMLAGWQSNFQVIMAKQTEYYVGVGFQIVEIIKWIKN